MNELNLNCPEIPDNPYRILMIGGFRSGKTNSLFNLISQPPGIDKIYLYAKDRYEAIYQFLINKRKSTGLNHFKDSKAFVEYLNNMDDIYKNIQEYNPNKKRNILIVFDDMIADTLSNRKLNPVVTELYLRGRKVNISIAFITQCYFAAPKNISLNPTHFLIMKISNKALLEQIAYNHSSDNYFKDFMNLHKKCTAKPYSFVVIDATLASDNL